MFFHLIPLQELKRHSVTYWRPGRDHNISTDTWVVLAETESGYVTTVLDVPKGGDAGSPQADDVLTAFLRDNSRQLR